MSDEELETRLWILEERTKTQSWLPCSLSWLTALLAACLCVIGAKVW